MLPPSRIEEREVVALLLEGARPAPAGERREISWASGGGGDAPGAIAVLEARAPAGAAPGAGGDRVAIRP